MAQEENSLVVIQDPTVTAIAMAEKEQVENDDEISPWIKRTTTTKRSEKPWRLNKFFSGRRPWEKRICLLLCAALCCSILAGCYFKLWVNSGHGNGNGNEHRSQLLEPNSIFYSSAVSEDESVDPCDDFYEYACGPQSERNVNEFRERSFAIAVKISLESSNPENGAEEKAQHYYRSCVEAAGDPTSLILTELIQLLEKLEEIPAGKLQEKLELLQNQYGLGPFFVWSVDLDFKESDKNVIQISHKESNAFGVDDPEAAGELSTRLLIESPHFETIMEKVFGHRLNLTGKPNDFDQLVSLDREIRELMQPPLLYESDSLSRYNSMNLTRLQNLAGFINWKKFFNNAFQNLNLTINDSEKIVIWCPQFLSKLSKKLQLLQNSPDGEKLVDKYLIWEVVKEILGDMLIAAKFSRRPFRHFSFSTYSYSATNVVAEMLCSIITQKHFDSAVASIHRRHLLKEYPDLEPRSTKMAAEMVEQIRQELILGLEQPDDQWPRDGAIKKVRKTRVMIGYPELVKNSTLLQEYYELCPQMNPSDFIGNEINLLKAERRENLNLKNLKNLKTRADKNDISIWSHPELKIMTNNAFTLVNLNLIFLPIRNLLPPNSHPQFPDSVNYASLGFRIGHEFFHGFHHLGSNWDEHGKFLGQSQDPNKKNGSDCLEHQYSKFQFQFQNSSQPGNFLNGTQTLAENFADNGGLEIATRVFFRLLTISEKKLKNDGNHRKDEDGRWAVERVAAAKLFFVTFAQSWCTSGPPQFSRDPHSPAKFRILGSLQNSKAFSETFQCPSGSRMNPPEKCSAF